MESLQTSDIGRSFKKSEFSGRGTWTVIFVFYILILTKQICIQAAATGGADVEEMSAWYCTSNMPCRWVFCPWRRDPTDTVTDLEMGRCMSIDNTSCQCPRGQFCSGVDNIVDPITLMSEPYLKHEYHCKDFPS